MPVLLLFLPLENLSACFDFKTTISKTYKHEYGDIVYVESNWCGIIEKYIHFNEGNYRHDSILYLILDRSTGYDIYKINFKTIYFNKEINVEKFNLNYSDEKNPDFVGIEIRTNF